MSLLFVCYLYRLMQLLSSGAWLVYLKLAFGELFLNEPALRMRPVSSYAIFVVGCMAGVFELNEPALWMLPLFSYATGVVECMAGLFEARLRRAFS